ncbi:hypothetical protein WOLCODRAFT_140169 [Wolfiporia cocos MD-104 SS10]|uniref:CRAL-TRIO domain-containing protein n=1 Tax=Wolfiporia cocos (strain MD-104) TaxID=742152 RepID=A0A2H3J898_WOLCO|nr:hypothetical protein WOLCODRAFT_140169 [Wolfiporia cocos MD-104 SS10]
MELLRRHLHWLNTSCRLCDGRRSRPLLQYEVLLNIDNITVIDLQQLVVLIDLLIRDVIPLYPGLFAAVYVVNHTRAHSHTWFFFKRLLPASARSRVFFPSKSELLEHFSATSLPLDLGGILPSSQLDNPLQMHVNENAAGIVTRAQATDPDSSTRSTDTIQTSGIMSTRSTSLSMSNPFYGYPVVYTPGQAVPVLRYGRRRKRDLIYTLGRLLWARWRRVFRLALYIVLAFIGCDVFQGVSSGKSHRENLWTGGRSPRRLDTRARAQRSREWALASYRTHLNTHTPATECFYFDWLSLI